MFYFKVQAVFSKDTDDNRRGYKGDGVNIGAKYIFVSNVQRPEWADGVGDFTITPNGLGTNPLDYQVILTYDPAKNVDECVIPVVFRNGKFQALSPFNHPKNGWDLQLFSFGRSFKQNQSQQIIYLVSVKFDGSARVDSYELIHDSVRVKDGNISIQLVDEQIYYTQSLHPNEEVVRMQMGPLTGDLAPFLFAAQRSVRIKDQKKKSA